VPHTPPYRIKSISEFHALRGFPKPEHPLISVINVESVTFPPGQQPVTLMLDFYLIALKRGFNAKLLYGQQEYDFDDGILSFMAPGQVFRIELDQYAALKQSGWVLLIHPDFLWHTPLAKTIRQYEFFDYSVHEALLLSEKEEAAIAAIIQNIEQEYHSRVDKFSQSVILAQLELLLTYADRFYDRQFITRKITNHQILDRLEELLTAYFKDDDQTRSGLPTVQYIADHLNVSPGYLSRLLKGLTGQSTQQHIHDKLVNTAKEKLSATDLSVSEIAYQLGFEHPQSFSKLFKKETSQSPLEFRQSFHWE
jgi:AraC family transcriptional regulator, transcriptional activator of pobA